MGGIRKTSLLISARPGLWRDALESYLKAKPELDLFITNQDFDDLISALHSRSYDMLLVEMGTDEDKQRELLARLKQEQAGLVCIVICDTPAQYLAVEGDGCGYAAMRLMLQTRFEEILSHCRSNRREGRARIVR
jgi:DNA-binding NarL/FixJ family response regulator